MGRNFLNSMNAISSDRDPDSSSFPKTRATMWSTVCKGQDQWAFPLPVPCPRTLFYN